MTINVDAERGVANQIAPGDRVDILVVDNGAANYILQNVKVLAVGQETAATAAATAAAGPTTNVAGSGLITFELSRADAATVVAANKSGTLYLALRPLAASAGGGSSVPASGK